MGKKNAGRKKVTALSAGEVGSKTGDNKAKSVQKIVKGSVEVRESSDSEDDSDTDVSSTDEEVIGAAGMWSSVTKKGRKGKQVVYVCAGGRKKCGKVIEGKDKCILCESCGKWFHTQCQELCHQAIDALESYELPWVCCSCRADLKQKRTLENKIDRCIEEKMKDMEKMLKAQLQESEKRLAQKFSDCK